MSFQKDDPYPCLIIDSASPEIPSVDLAGTEDILKFLEKEGFIGPYKSHSAKESQTLEAFIEPVVSTFTQDMLLSSVKRRF